jgi:spoIIIJ-associated protein
MSDDTDVTFRPDDVHDDAMNDMVGGGSAGEPLDELDLPDRAGDDIPSAERPDSPPESEDDEAVHDGWAADGRVESASAESRPGDAEDAEVHEYDDAEDAEDAGESDELAPAPSGGSRVRVLEREGEVAADFLERLLDIADLDGDIEVDIDGDRASVAIVDSEDGRVPRRLVGSEGKVLDALQELTRLAVQAETGERSRLMLDIAGHRAQRRAVVVEIAQSAIAEVKTSGSKRALDDMSAFERKIVHDEVAAAGLSSESEGVEPHRHIVVFPA